MVNKWSACSPSPWNDRLSSSSFVWFNVFSFICELIMRISVIVKEIKVSWVKEVTIWWVTEINHSTFFWLIVYVKNLNTFITILWSFHSANSIQSNKAVWKIFSFVIPFLASIGVIAEISSESISFLRSRSWITCNWCVTNVSVWWGSKLEWSNWGNTNKSKNGSLEHIQIYN